MLKACSYGVVEGEVTRFGTVACQSLSRGRFHVHLQARQNLSLESRGCKVVCKRSLFFDHD